MEIFYTSDIHFGDERIMRLCNRPFSSTKEMDDYIVSRWNRKVKNEDVVYILGDLSSAEVFDASTINRLNGDIFIVFGNHDFPIKGLICKNTKIDSNGEPLYRDDIKDMGRKIIMFHYPIMDWDGINDGTVLLYGHVHNKHIAQVDDYYKDKLGFNVCMDVNDFEPKTLKELIKDNNKKELFCSFDGGNA